MEVLTSVDQARRLSIAAPCFLVWTLVTSFWAGATCADHYDPGVTQTEVDA